MIINPNLPVPKSITIEQVNAMIQAAVPKQTSQLQNDSGFLTQHQDISGKFDKSGGTITGDIRVQGTGKNFGNKINLGDGDYVHFCEPTDDCLEIKAKKINFVTSDTTDQKFTLNGSAIGADAEIKQGTGDVSIQGGSILSKSVSFVSVGKVVFLSLYLYVSPGSTSTNLQVTLSGIPKSAYLMRGAAACKYESLSPQVAAPCQYTLYVASGSTVALAFDSFLSSFNGGSRYVFSVCIPYVSQ